MPAVNVTVEAHEAAKREAAAAGVGIGEWVTQRILEPAVVTLPAVVPKKDEVVLHPDGQPYCKCDGDSAYGPHHKEKCHRRTA